MPVTEPAGQSQRPSLRYSPTRMIVLWSVGITGALAVLGFVVTWILADAATAAAVLLGAVLSIGVFAVGIIAIRGILAGPSQTTLAGAMLLLMLQLGITVAALVLASRFSSLDMTALGVAFVAAGIVFQIGAVTGALRSRSTVEVGAGSAAPGTAPAPGASATVSSVGQEVRDAP